MSDCLWGLLDGMNDAGLAVSLAFGGRRVLGDGFGIPLVVRYVLETCATVDEARRGAGAAAVFSSRTTSRWSTVAARSSPRTWRPTASRSSGASRRATNHQGTVEWAEHARATRTIERERRLPR